MLLTLQKTIIHNLHTYNEVTNLQFKKLSTDFLKRKAVEIQPVHTQFIADKLRAVQHVLFAT